MAATSATPVAPAHLIARPGRLARLAGVPEAMPIDPATPLSAGLRSTVQGTNGFRRAICRGPRPAARQTAHTYHLVVYALDAAVVQPPTGR